MVYEFTLGDKAAKETQNICFTKGKDAVYHRQFKKCDLACKNLDDQVILAKPKTVDSKAVL